MIRRFTQNGESRNKRSGNRRGFKRAAAAVLAALVMFHVPAAGTVPGFLMTAAAADEIPTLGTLPELREYLQTCLAAGRRDCSFYYTGSREDLEGDDIARMTNALYCHIRVEEKADTGKLFYNIQLVPHAGEAVVEAFRAGDLSGLTDDEIGILEQALGIVDYLRMEEGLSALYDDDEGAFEADEEEDQTSDDSGDPAEAAAEDPGAETADRIKYLEQLAARMTEQAYKESDISVELRIHDWLCQQVEYAKDVPAISDPEKVAPEYSAIGALRDGKANCQGYADAFYLLGSLAGYEVGFQSAEDRDTGKGHVFNTVRLGENWYAVDVTGDDNAMKTEGEVLQDYHLFNAGKDIVGEEYTWPEALEIRPLAEQSDHYYYYFWDEQTGTDGAVRCYDSAAGIAEAELARLREGGEGPGYYLWRGHEDSGKELDAALSEALQKEETKRTCRYFMVLRSGSTYYRLTIE